MIMENTSIQVVSHGGGVAMTIKDIADRVNLVHQVLEKVMIKGTHYGTVPGCGARMVLLKPGADVLAMTFQLVPQFAITRSDLPGGHREYDVTCSMYSASGALMGQGVGSGSTMEKKYRYRKDERGQKIEHEDIADVYNTVLKMAKKRAHVDATLTVTGAGDMFTQDLIEEDEDQPNRAPVAMPQPVQAERKAAPAEATTGSVERGTIEQVAVKTGEGKKGTWKKWGVSVGGAWYSTFDVPLGTKAEALKGRVVDLTYKDDGKFKTVLDVVEVADAAQPESISCGAPIAETTEPLPF